MEANQQPDGSGGALGGGGGGAGRLTALPRNPAWMRVAASAWAARASSSVAIGGRGARAGGRGSRPPEPRFMVLVVSSETFAPVLGARVT